MRDKKQWVLQRHKEANKGILMCQMKKKKLPWFNCSGRSYGMAKLYTFSRWYKALGHIESGCCCAFMPHIQHWYMVQFRCWCVMAAAKWQKTSLFWLKKRHFGKAGLPAGRCAHPTFVHNETHHSTFYNVSNIHLFNVLRLKTITKVGSTICSSLFKAQPQKNPLLWNFKNFRLWWAEPSTPSPKHLCLCLWCFH